MIDSAGNDTYSLKGEGLSYSINRSVTLLMDLGGEDSYTMKEGNRPGMALFDERHRDRASLSTYFADSTSLGLFLDIGGNDTYQGQGANNATWLDPSDSPNGAVRNYSVGADRGAGKVDLTPRPEKAPTGSVRP